jgi:hypothetical protein
MNIILNEHEWAKNMLQSHSLGKKPTETLGHIARYYIDEHQGEKAPSKRDVRKKLESFLLQCDPYAAMPKWNDTLTYVINRAFKRDTIYIEHISINQSELDKIDVLKGKQLRRLAFTLLCLSKYWDNVNSTDTHWVNTQDSDIMKMANIVASIKRQSQLYNELSNLGLIKFSKKVDNTNVRVCFATDDVPVLYISDFRNLGYQYERYRGIPYRACQNCGLVFKSRTSGSGPQAKYCADCAEKKWLEQRINAVMRQRKSAVI